MTVYLPRSAWTTSSRGGSTLSGARLLGCSVHYPASATPINANSQEQIAERIRAWRNFHVNVRGWSDIGYQVGGDQAGRVWDLRGINRVPAATASQGNPDANHEWGAFLFMIGNSEQPSPALVEAFQHWRHTRWLARWPGATRIVGHGQVPGAQTSCPGARTLALIDAGVLARTPATPPPPPTPTLEGSDMLVIQQANRDTVWYIESGVRRHIRTLPLRDELVSLPGVSYDRAARITSELLTAWTTQGPDIGEAPEVPAETPA